MNRKIKELQEYLKKKKIDSALIFNYCTNDPNFLYFCGVDIGASYLLIPKKGPAELLINETEYERAKKESRIRKIKKFSRGKEIKEYFQKKIKNKVVGVNYEKVTLGSAKRLRKYCKIKDISRELIRIRSIKTEEEIKKIKKSCSIASNIIKTCIKNFKKFKTETDVKEFLEKEALKRKCKVDFAIVASGINASMPHYNACNVNLKKGFCVIDFGVIYKNYCSDITRTLYIGKPSKKEVEVYNKVLKIQEECIRKVKQGLKAKNLDSFARKKLKGFIHSLGHGVGIEIHEYPNISDESKDILKKNMVFTIEPGTYKAKRYGIRIEDTILLKDKAEILTKVDKKLKIIN